MVNVEYKAALTHFTQSGTHDSNFYNFCNGKPDVYYLRKYLELKPNLDNTVEEDLPEDHAILSDMIGNIFYRLRYNVAPAIFNVAYVNAEKVYTHCTHEHFPNIVQKDL